MHKQGLVYLVTVILCLTACTSLPPSGNINGPATYNQRMDLKTGGFQRSYRVHVPSGYNGTTKMPMVVVIHGAFDTAKGIEKISGFSTLADKEDFVVLYPEGIGIFGYLQHWNAGHCCGKAAEDQIDDVGYLATAIEDACTHLSVDRQRIYMVGFSNGGMLTYRFAAERTEMLAAAAPIAASIGGRPTADAPPWSIPKPKKPLPILVMHGLDDDDIRVEGGRSMHRKGERSYFSVADSVRFWVDANACIGKPVEARIHRGAVSVRSWDRCGNDSVVVLCQISGWGHTWPGPYFTAGLPDHDPLFNYDAAEMVWSFFKRFP